MAARKPGVRNKKVGGAYPVISSKVNVEFVGT